MTLTLRPTGLAAPVDGDHKDFIIMSGEFVLGRIYEECGARPELRWYWAINGVHAGPTVMRKDGRARSLEGAKAQFADNWQKWLAWAGLKSKSSKRFCLVAIRQTAPLPLRGSERGHPCA